MCRADSKSCCAFLKASWVVWWIQPCITPWIHLLASCAPSDTASEQVLKGGVSRISRESFLFLALPQGPPATCPTLYPCHLGEGRGHDQLTGVLWKGTGPFRSAGERASPDVRAGVDLLRSILCCCSTAMGTLENASEGLHHSGPRL